MSESLVPRDEADIEEAVRAARAGRWSYGIVGGGSASGFGRPVETATVLSTAGLTGITLHEPAELVISARGGTPLRAVETALDVAGQRLAFEPMDMRPLLGTSGEPTIGAVAAANLSGPRRIQAGACRDSLIGLRLATGRGETIRAGGRVMKNVTGLDLVKLAAGSHGTLGVLTEVTFKLVPKPETEATLSLLGLTDSEAIEVLGQALGSPFEVTGAAHLPKVDDASAVTCLRVEGFEASVKHRLDALSSLLKGRGSIERLDAPTSAALWRQVRDAMRLAEPAERAVWRISTAPTNGPRLVAAVSGVVRDWFYDWGGGLVWLSSDGDGDAGAGAIRAALKPLGGHATLVRAPDDLRARVEVFEPLAAPLMAITREMKLAFDPDGVFNRGRMYSGI